MILYNKKPKKMFIGGLISLATKGSDLLGASNTTNKHVQTGATILDPMGAATDAFSDSNASTSSKVRAGVNAVAPGFGSYGVGKDTAERNDINETEEETKIKKAKALEQGQISAEGYANQYAGLQEGAVTQQPTQTVTDWYNKR